MNSRASVIPAAPAPTMQTSVSMTVPGGTDRASTNMRHQPLRGSENQQRVKHVLSTNTIEKRKYLKRGWRFRSRLLLSIDRGMTLMLVGDSILFSLSNRYIGAQLLLRRWPFLNGQ